MQRAALRLIREPTTHFFMLGALLFVLHRAFSSDPRRIVLTQAIRADVQRRFTDQNGRPPSAAELAQSLSSWRRDEALYREALREGLDRDDATVRTVLADKVRARAALEAPKRLPTRPDLERWLDEHRAVYETTRRYEYQILTFEKSVGESRELERVENALAAGRAENALGRPVEGGTLSLEELSQKYGRAFAERLAAGPLGVFRRFERDQSFVLARVTRTEGGLPNFAELQDRLAADWSRAMEQRAVDEAVERVVSRYRFEVTP